MCWKNLKIINIAMNLKNNIKSNVSFLDVFPFDNEIENNAFMFGGEQFLC